MGTENVTHTKTLLNYERKEILSFSAKWMQLEDIILSERSQTQKVKWITAYSILYMKPKRKVNLNGRKWVGDIQGHCIMNTKTQNKGKSSGDPQYSELTTVHNNLLYFIKNYKRGAWRLPTKSNDKEIEMLIALIWSVHAVYIYFTPYKITLYPIKHVQSLHVNQILKVIKNK